MPFRFTTLAIPGPILVEAAAFEDPRGVFVETYKRSEFEAGGIHEVFVQDNYSYSVYRVLRGLHYQRHPMAQGKLVGVVHGKIFDVAVDIRADSPAYTRWISVILCGHDHRMLYVPEGFAHGFCVLSNVADVVYKVTAEYSPELETGVRWNDPLVDVRWPIADPILSAKDAALPFLRDPDHRSRLGGSR